MESRSKIPQIAWDACMASSGTPVLYDYPPARCQCEAEVYCEACQAYDKAQNNPGKTAQQRRHLEDRKAKRRRRDPSNRL